MLVSIITVVYNGSSTISQAIESVLGQTYPEIEYIIVDGLSKDNTVEIAESYRLRFEAKGYSYRVISEKDNGIYDAMNKGIRLASGELVGMINCDDWYEPNAVEVAAATYRDEPYDMFYADIRIIMQDGRSIIKHSRMDRLVISSRHWNHPTTFITKAAYNEMGLYRCESIYDDLDLLLRFRRAKKKIAIRNVVLANFRFGGVSNDRTLSKCVERYHAKYKCYQNNGYSPLYRIECFIMEVSKYILSR